MPHLELISQHSKRADGCNAGRVRTTATRSIQPPQQLGASVTMDNDDNRLLRTLPSGSKGIPERVIFLVGDRAALDRLAEIQHGAGLRIEHRPLWQANAVRVA